MYSTSRVAQGVKNPPGTQETQVRSLGWEDPPGEGNSYSLQYSCLENPLNRGAWRATVLEVAKIRHNWVTEHRTHTRTHTQYCIHPPCLQAKGLGIGRTLESSRGLREQTLKQPALDRIDRLWELLKPFLCAGGAFLGGRETYAIFPYGREGNDILGGRKLTHIWMYVKKRHN